MGGARATSASVEAPAHDRSGATAAELLRYAVSAQQEGDQPRALELLLRVLEISPEDWVAHTCLGGTLKALGRLDEAIAIHRRAVELGGDHRAISNLALAYREAGRLDEAITALETAVARAPGEADLHGNLSGVLLAADRPVEAEAAARRALAIGPGARFESNLGYARKEQGDFAGAAVHLRRALARDPDDADAHWNLGLTLLAAPASLAEEAEGWRELEWRQQIRGLGIVTAGEAATIPRWSGAPLAGRTLLLQAEQGLGDTLQLARYAQWAKALAGAGRTILECQPPLAPLLHRCVGVDTIVARGAVLPRADLRAGLFSLPALLGGRARGGLSATAYLSAEPERVARWRGIIAARTAGASFRIGIAWQGNPRYRADRRRSIALANFAPLFRAVSAAGGAIVSLQKGDGREQLAGLPSDAAVADFGPELDAEGAFLDTAALMTALDLVITSDTAIPHLAGALGLPVWMALAHLPDWRWGLKGEDCVWYPSMRLFRQGEAGDWAGVFARIARAVDERFADGSAAFAAAAGGAP